MKKTILLYGSFLCFGLMSAELKAMEKLDAADENEDHAAEINVDAMTIAEIKQNCRSNLSWTHVCNTVANAIIENKIRHDEGLELIYDLQDEKPDMKHTYLPTDLALLSEVKSRMERNQDPKLQELQEHQYLEITRLDRLNRAIDDVAQKVKDYEIDALPPAENETDRKMLIDSICVPTAETAMVYDAQSGPLRKGVLAKFPGNPSIKKLFEKVWETETEE